MLTKETVFNVSREGYALLANTKGNNGRALRRFLSRVSADGLVLQVFTDFGKTLTDSELALYAAYADAIRAKSLDYFDEAAREVSYTIVDRCFSIVQNSYRLELDIPTAPVWQLRAAVRKVVALSDCMHKFAGNPAGELYTVSPEAAQERAAELVRREEAAYARFDALFMRGFVAEGTDTGRFSAAANSFPRSNTPKQATC